MRIISIAGASIAAAMAFAQPGDAQEEFPELGRPMTDRQIVAQLQKELIDPTSITDLRTCAPFDIKMSAGHPSKWLIYFSVNSKNGYGGYSGITYYSAIFRSDKRVLISQLVKANADGLDSIIVRVTEKRMVDCRLIPDAEVQRMLAQ